MSVISLMTDFGIKDGNVGVMKGVIWGIAPEAHIADLSHLVRPQNVLEAAYILGRSVPYFPPNSVHVVVVDPGVGTERRPMAARFDSQYFVGPDNGVITVLLERAERTGAPIEMVHLDVPRYWLDEISNVFHGRDIFSPVGAHLAAGVALNEVGTAFEDPVRLDLPLPEKTEEGLNGQVIHIDHFGNIATNVRVEDLPGVHKIKVHLRDESVPGLYKTFGELAVGELMALYGSTGSLIVSEVNGSAAARIGASVGDPIRVEKLG